MPQVTTTDHERDLDLEQQILQAIKHVRYGSVEINIFVIFIVGQSNGSFLTSRTGT